MRKDITIQVNSENNQVLRSNDCLGISTENLQGKIIFKPEPFVDGICRMYVNNKGSILMQKEEGCYTLDILSSLLTETGLDVCFKITEAETEEGTPIFATKIMHFKVLDTIDTSGEIPEEYPTWEQVLDSKIAELTELEETVEEAEQSRNQRVNQEIERLENIVIDYDEDIQELQESVETNTNDINDIKQEITLLSLVTETGSKIELAIDNQTYILTAKLKDKNNNVISTSNEIDLPLETMVVGASYDSETKELVITLKNGQTTRVSVADLVSGLIKNTDYASNNTAGIIKMNNTYGFVIDSNKRPYLATILEENYDAKPEGTFIGKGTLDNVLTRYPTRVELNEIIGDIESLLEVI